MSLKRYAAKRDENENKMDLIQRLKEAEFTLDADGYKEWCNVRLSISDAIKVLEVKSVELRYFMVFNPVGEDWEQMSIAFKTFEEAKSYYDRQDKNKHPYLRILAECKYYGV